jgi:hypothetical protein
LTATLALAVLSTFGLRAPASVASTSTGTLLPMGVGGTRFGESEARALAALTRQFGSPAARGFNTGCGRRYTEVAWGDFVAEFRAEVFSGYRYLIGGYPLTTPGSPREPRPATITPRLATAAGISLGSTLSQLRSAYPGLRLAGASRWKAANGLIFTDDARRDPEPLTSRIVEIKIGACSDF